MGDGTHREALERQLRRWKDDALLAKEHLKHIDSRIRNIQIQLEQCKQQSNPNNNEGGK